MNEITLMSFGYLYGLPEEADTVIGTRGLPNPYYAETLKGKTGLDPEVRDYVFSSPESEKYFEAVRIMLRRRIAFYHTYSSPLKQPLVIAVGCSGGKHRSVSMTYRLAEALQRDGIPVRVVHRDLNKRLEHSAGAVLFTRQAGEIRYGIIQSLSGHHGFPKGHMEPGETEEETALREIREETGLTTALRKGFRTVEIYRLPQQPDTWKQVVYYLAESENQPLRVQREELRSAEFMTLAAALEALEHESSRRILMQADTFLNQSEGEKP